MHMVFFAFIVMSDHHNMILANLELKVALSFQILAENLVQQLPTNLGKLQSLKLMTLDGNQIASLPDESNSLL